MKTTIIITLGIWLLAYSQIQVTNVNDQETYIIVANRSINYLSNMHIERRQHEYKYKTPIAVGDFDKKTSPFNYRELLNPYTGGTRNSNHMGLDLVGTWHCLISPIALNGEVIDKWYVVPGHPIHGGYVRIKHPDDWIESHSHLSKIYVKEHDRLIDGIFYRKNWKGEWNPLPSGGYIGRQGDTGQSEGEHLHLGIQTPDGKFVDPLHYIDL